jgi:hypothetical protein
LGFPDFFEKEFGREFEKFWKVALKRATDGNLKEPTLLPRVEIDQEDSICDDLFTCHVLVKIKVRKVVLRAFEIYDADHS